MASFGQFWANVCFLFPIKHQKTRALLCSQREMIMEYWLEVCQKDKIVYLISLLTIYAIIKKGNSSKSNKLTKFEKQGYL